MARGSVLERGQTANFGQARADSPERRVGLAHARAIAPQPLRAESGKATLRIVLELAVRGLPNHANFGAAQQIL